MSKLTTTVATVPNGGTTSPAVDVRDHLVVGLQVGTWTAGNLTIQGSVDGVTYQNLDGGSGALSFFTGGAGSKYVSFAEAVRGYMEACMFIKLVSAVNQGADRPITLILLPRSN